MKTITFKANDNLKDKIEEAVKQHNETIELNIKEIHSKFPDIECNAKEMNASNFIRIAVEEKLRSLGFDINV